MSLQPRVIHRQQGDCQNYGPYYNTGPNTGPNLGDPRRDHNFDNPPTGGEHRVESALHSPHWGGLLIVYDSKGEGLGLLSFDLRTYDIPKPKK